MKRELSYYSEGCKIAADLYLPQNIEEGSSLPAIVMCHGFAGIKEILLPNYAEFFAENGFAVLIFDYRGFGASEGERGHLIPHNQIVDIQNSITFLQTLPEVDGDRIALWGSSFGGANAISVAARDLRVSCVAVQLTFGSGYRVISNGKSNEDISALKSTMDKVQQRAVTKNRSLALSPDQILTDQQSIDFYNDIVKKYPQIDVPIPMLTIKRTMEYIPEDELEKVTVPLFIVSAENDSVNPVSESESLFEKAREPKQYYCVKGASHYEIYEGEHFKDVSRRQLEWFNRYLVTQLSSS